MNSQIQQQQQRRSRTPVGQRRDRSQDDRGVTYQAKGTGDKSGTYNLRSYRGQGNGKQVSLRESMYKATGDPRQIELLTDGVEFLDTPQKIMTLINDYKTIRVHTDECLFDKSVLIKDLSLIAKGYDEDVVLASDPYLWTNFRRGNTLIELYDPADFKKLQKIAVARKGLTKFFDVKLDFISKERRYAEESLSAFESETKNLTFAPLKKAILEGAKVELVKTLKANGENCQVSYSADLQAFVIASKNVSLVASSVQDIELYIGTNKMRYDFAIMMAQCWFRLISVFKKKDLESLKADMAGKTWVGEYVGNVQCQHLVKYPRETIIFYAIVDNNSSRICKLPEDSMKIFKKYAFDVVGFETLGVYSDYDKLCDDTEKEFRIVAGQTIAEEEEGAVLYMIRRDMEDSRKDQVLSLSKLKTLEYRLFRKMREKLRNYTIKFQDLENPTERTIQNYIKEAKDLCRGFNIPHPIEFYIDLCVLAFQLTTRGSLQDKSYFQDLLQREYIHFLEEVINVHEERNRGKKNGAYAGRVSFDSIVLDNQHAIQYQAPQLKRNATPQDDSSLDKSSTANGSHTQSTTQGQKSESSTSNATKEMREVKDLNPTKPVQARRLPLRKLGKNIVVVVPPLGIEMEAVNALREDFLGGFQETCKFSYELLEQRSGQPINLIIVNSLQRLAEDAVYAQNSFRSQPASKQSKGSSSHYFLMNCTESFLKTGIYERFEKQNEDGGYYLGLAQTITDDETLGQPLKLESREYLASLAEIELAILKQTLDTLKEKGVLNVHTDVTDERELMQSILKIKEQFLSQKALYRPKQPNSSSQTDPKQQTDHESKASQAETRQPPARKILDSQPVYQKKVQESTATPRQVVSNLPKEESKGDEVADTVVPKEKVKKHVKINDTPQVTIIQEPMYVLKNPKPKQEANGSFVASTVTTTPKQPILTQKIEPTTQNSQAAKQTKSNAQEAIKTKHIVVVLPIGIPGMGKTTFINDQLKGFFPEDQVSIQVVSNDQHRKRMVDLYIERNPSKTKLDAYDQTHQQTAKAFSQALLDALHHALNSKEHEYHLIVLDKNHPPSALPKAIQSLDTFNQQECQNRFIKFSKIALIPEQPYPHKMYPFSLSFLVQCYLRTLDREEHETLTNEDPYHLAEVIIKFFRFYFGQKFDKQFLRAFGFDNFLEVPLTLEAADLQLPMNLYSLLEKILESPDISQEQNGDELIERFVYLVTLYQTFFIGSNYHPEQDEVQENELVKKQFSDILGLTEVVQKQGKVAQGKGGKKTQTAALQKNTQQESQKQSIRQVIKKQEESQSQAATQPKQSSQSRNQESGTSDSLTFTPSQTKETAASTPQSTVQKVEEESKEQTHNSNHTDNGSHSTRTVTKLSNDGFQEAVLPSQSRKVTKQFPKKNGSLQCPIFIGLSLDWNKQDCRPKIKNIMLDAMKMLLTNFNIGVIRDTVASVEQVWKHHKPDSNGWKNVDDFHVTVMFLGKDEYKLDKPLFQDFVEDQDVTVELLALVVVPNKLITGICFPNHPSENRAPHVTIMRNEWLPQHSNNVLEVSCLDKKSPFNQAYEELKAEGKVKDESTLVLKGDYLKILPRESSVSAYMIILPKPVTFTARTKIYY